MHLSLRLVGFDMLVGRVRRLPPRPIDSARARLIRAPLDSIAALPRSARTPGPPERFQVALASGDTGAARRVLAEYDSTITPQANGFSSAFTQELFGSARMHLAVHDTAGAEAQLAKLERLVMKAPFQNNFAIASLGPWLGEAWLLAGDVAAARGRRAEGDGMYRRLIGLWEGGDPDLQHLVRDAQAHLALLR